MDRRRFSGVDGRWWARVDSLGYGQAAWCKRWQKQQQGNLLVFQDALGQQSDCFGAIAVAVGCGGRGGGVWRASGGGAAAVTAATWAVSAVGELGGGGEEECSVLMWWNNVGGSASLMFAWARLTIGFGGDPPPQLRHKPHELAYAA